MSEIIWSKDIVIEDGKLKKIILDNNSILNEDIEHIEVGFLVTQERTLLYYSTVLVTFICKQGRYYEKSMFFSLFITLAESLDYVSSSRFFNTNQIKENVVAADVKSIFVNFTSAVAGATTCKANISVKGRNDQIIMLENSEVNLLKYVNMYAKYVDGKMLEVRLPILNTTNIHLYLFLGGTSIWYFITNNVQSLMVSAFALIFVNLLSTFITYFSLKKVKKNMNYLLQQKIVIQGEQSIYLDSFFHIIVTILLTLFLGAQ